MTYYSYASVENFGIGPFFVELKALSLYYPKMNNVNFLIIVVNLPIF